MNTVETMETGDVGGELYRRYTLQSAGILLALWVVGYWPTLNLAPESGLQGMLVGGCLAWVASWVGTIPVHRSRHKSPLDSMSAVMGSIALRLVVAMVLALAAALSGVFDPAPLLLWVAIAHAGLLVADTSYGRAHNQIKSERQASQAASSNP